MPRPSFDIRPTLVPNPEITADTTGWTAQGLDSFTATSEGGLMVKAVTSGPADIYVDIPTEVGVTYRFSARYKLNAGPNTMKLIVSDPLTLPNSLASSGYFDAPIGTWGEATVDYVATVANSRFRVARNISGSQTDLVVTDIMVARAADVVENGTVADAMRLEIELDPSPGTLTNLVENPSGEQGGYGWVTPVAGSVLVGTNDAYTSYQQGLKYTTAANAGGNYFQSEAFPVAAGQYAAAFWHVNYTPYGYHRARIEWLNSSQAQIGQTAWSSFVTSYRDCNLPAALAPASTAYARIKFEVAQSGGTYPATGAGLLFSVRQVTVSKAATSGALGQSRVNLALNPSLETNTTGWTPFASSNMSVARSSAQAKTGTWSLLVTRTAVTANYLNSAVYSMPLSPNAPGLSYTFSAHVRAGNAVQNNAQIGVRYTTSTGSGPWVFGGSTITTSTTWQRMSVTAVAPTGTTSVEVRVIVGDDQTVGRTAYIDGLMINLGTSPYDYFDGATAAGGGWSYTWSGTANASTSVATTSNLGFTAPIEYGDFLGDVHELSLTRGELNPGDISVTVANAALDPAVVDFLRPGRRFRLMAYRPSTWRFEPLIQGRLLNAKTGYLPLSSNGKTALVTVTGTDNTSALAKATRPQTVATVDELPYVLEGCGVPWNCNGSGNHVASATVVVENENTTALDQVALTRDTELGYAWVDRWGVLQAWSAMPATTPVPLDETVYNPNLVVDYDTDRCINSVSVLRQWTHATEGVQGTLYGPYTDDPSIAEWGRHHVEVNVAGTAIGSIPTYAASILAANATPQVRVQSLEVAVLDNARLAYAFTDLYDLVNVTNAETAVNADLRVTGVTHTIRATEDGGEWLVGMEFASEGGVATPTQQPPLKGAAVPSGWTVFTKVSPTASMANITLEYRISGNLIEWRVSGSTAAAIAVPASGDVANQNVTTSIPAELRPASSNWTFTISMGFAVHVAITPGGNFTLYAAEGTGTAYNIASGAAFSGQSPAFVLP